MIVVFFGPPGCGKGTQAQYLVNKYGFIHISTGDLLRKEIEAQTTLGKEIESVIESGGYISDKPVIELIEKALAVPGSNNYIFDGFPRTLNQALAFEELLSVKKLKVDLVFNFEVDTNLLIERISGRFSCSECGSVYNDTFKKTLLPGICDKCGGDNFIRRKDDHPEVYKKRVEVYLNETKTIQEFYQEKKLVKTIDASQTAETIQQKIMECLVQAGFII